MTTRIFITGIVQGVGFRPCCKKAADSLGLSGTARNLGGNAEIIIRCETQVTEIFLRRLVSLLPKEARIDSIEKTPHPEYEGEGFTIIESGADCGYLPEIVADIATCHTCLAQLADPKDRRYRHPFISCAACGPRYSVIKALPYDRPNTLMDKFPLCPQCMAEYTDPADRRLHAQTIACKACGPTLSFYPEGRGDPIDRAIEVIKKGGVVAVKDIGGYHFVCLPNCGEAVGRLRLLKLRDKKPLAVMFADTDSLKEYALLTPQEEALLEGSARPIVLVEKRKEFHPAVSSDSRFLGAMLPCNPVQIMLTEALGPLVMTSGNVSGEPIITDNSTMLSLCDKSPYLDGVLHHDRDIITPLDDSIYYVIGGREHLMRRGRGVAPAAISADLGDKTLFAAGSDLKACFGFYKNGRVILSQHFGDLEDDGCAEAFDKAARHISSLFSIPVDATVCDLHPAYFSGRLALYIYPHTPLTVQHHHAHIASVMAEHSLEECIGFAFDGTGYGEDGTVWGGEALICKGAEYTRFAHLASVPLCGGDAVAKNAAEAAVCYLLAGGNKIPGDLMETAEAEIIEAAVRHNINTLPSSSCGRLFDAACAILGLGSYNDYEGQCAVLLENAADKAKKSNTLAYPLNLDYNNGILDTVGLIGQIASAKASGADPCSIALGFHLALAEGIVKVALAAGITDVALSGGTFLNRILLTTATERLTASGFRVYTNQKVPCGDGGLALGQLFIAGRKEI